MGDFEIAPRTALREAFQGIHIVGCQFHLANSLYKKVGQLELRGLYASDPQFKKWILAINVLISHEVRGHEADIVSLALLKQSRRGVTLDVVVSSPSRCCRRVLFLSLHQLHGLEIFKSPGGGFFFKPI
jgi:hypothetical protein